ncbi:MAG TPA: trimeric intracellular cation channel family protein [Ramlibacter sp.]|uniref:trimeric intracellular cation channel family protein n=1 Tax=Ramlibacter sp. TaxID=1917967 RepID=UPI002D80EB95|nr:trimeric intracellular cation channel family protein [Ramlibacter sp.]HET8746971.1 trimeric intracellular cation channel family protein [Ramlibacter sp.]
MEQHLFVLVDLLGTFAFAVSGALAAEQKRLDLFGVAAISLLTACGGGVIRDLCLGALPPVGISDWRYLATSMAAAACAIWARRLIAHLEQPILFFDALGLGFFAVTGALKALLLQQNVEVAILLGLVTAVGGGVMRDVMLTRVPVILQKEIYALAALLGAAIQVLGHYLEWRVALTPWFAASVCVALRLLALRYSWSLPVVQGRDRADR